MVKFYTTSLEPSSLQALLRFEYLGDVSVEDTQHPGELELLLAFDGQLLDPVPSLEEDFKFALNLSTLLSAQLLLQLVSQLLQRGQLHQTQGGNNISTLNPL